MKKIITNTLDNMVVKGKQVVMAVSEEEKGASDLIAVVVLIVILLAVALIFKNKLVDIVNALGDKVSDWISSN